MWNELVQCTEIRIENYFGLWKILKECTTKLETLCALSPIGISNPKTKLVLLEKGLNCQRNLSFGGLNKKGQNNRTRLLLYLVSSSVQFCWNFFSSFFPFQSLCSLKALLNFLNYFTMFLFFRKPRGSSIWSLKQREQWA